MSEWEAGGFGGGGGGGFGAGALATWAKLRTKFPTATGAFVGGVIATAVQCGPGLAAAAGGGAGQLGNVWSLLTLGRFGGPRSDAVDGFLRDVHLGLYADAFRAVGFMDQEDMLGMTELDLVADVQVPFAAHRRRILAHAARRQAHLARESVIWALLCAGAMVAGAYARSDFSST